MKCLFCGSEVRLSRANLVNCGVCGIVPNPKKLVLDGDEVKILREVGVMRASKIVADHGVKGLEYILRYESLRRKKLYSEIKMLTLPRGLDRGTAERVLANLFGYISPSEMVMAQFLRICGETGLPANRIADGMAMLNRIVRKRTLKLSEAAAVYYHISGKTQATVSKMFGITDVALRNSLRRLEEEGIVC